VRHGPCKCALPVRRAKGLRPRCDSGVAARLPACGRAAGGCRDLRGAHEAGAGAEVSDSSYKVSWMREGEW
jgi:hypothetical protein